MTKTREQELSDINAVLDSGREATPEEVEKARKEGKLRKMRIKRCNETVEESKLRPDPPQLWGDLWYRGEVCCVFADSNIGKSIYAVQIGDWIAKREPVVYFDFELSEKQFQLRYTDKITRQSHTFPENFYRADLPDVDELTPDEIINEIRLTAEEVNAKVVIIDNITQLCNQLEKGEDAGRFTTLLKQLRDIYGFSVLVVAHTPKRAEFAPLTQNSLAGSKRLFNAFDSCFAIGLSAKDPKQRYIKQLKARNCEILYGANNVIIAELVNKGNMMYFDKIGHSKESDLLIKKSFADSVLELYENGYKQTEIAEMLDSNKDAVSRAVVRLRKAGKLESKPKRGSGSRPDTSGSPTAEEKEPEADKPAEQETAPEVSGDKS